MSLKSLLGMTRDFLDLRSGDLVDRFIDGVDWNMIQRSLGPVENPVSKHLTDCLPHAGKAETGLVKMMIENAPLLCWFNSYDDDAFGGGVGDKLCSVEIGGPQGHFMSDQIRFGFYLQAPELAYPDHWHQAAELYIPLTSSTLWSKDNGEFVARKSGEIIVHESNEHHAMTTTNGPLLALWIWRGGDLQQKPEY